MSNKFFRAISFKNYGVFFWMVICACLLLGVFQALASNPDEQASPLIINEFVAYNGTGLTDEDGDFSDWIEIYNRTNTPLNLAGWALTDDPNELNKWTFPDLTLDANTYLVIFASGKDRKPAKPDETLHTNFNLSKSGEYLALYNVLDEQVIPLKSDQYPQQFRDIAYGFRQDQQAYVYLDAPTPGHPNHKSPTWKGVSSSVQFSRLHGFYDTPFLLELTTDSPDVVIVYTTDGSEPGEMHGTIYTQPIQISTTTAVRAVSLRPDYLPSSVKTQSYIFLNEVLNQPAQPPGFPSTWGTHKKSIWEYAEGTPVVADYEMDPEIVNHPAYRNTIKDDLKSIPTLSLVTDVSSFTDLYSNPQERGRAWERAVSVELIYPNLDQKGFQIDAGIRIHGARGREEYMPKHSFRLFFRAQYGATRLNFPLFPDSPVESFDTLILRGGVNRSYAGQLRSDKTGFELTAYTRDEWLRDSQIEMSGLSAHGIFVHLYINGLYWGLYNVVERPDAVFMASYLGGDETDWYAMNADGPINNTTEEFERLKLELAGIIDLPPEQRYPAIQQRVDIDHFIDYLILNWYAGTKDWPHNNWYAGVRLPAGQIKHFVWDAEVTWLEGAHFTLGDGNNTIKQFFDAFVNYPDFRIALADRTYMHLFNNGVLADANSSARWMHLNNIINRAIVGESARWGDARYATPITRQDWLNARDDVLAQMENNGAKLIALLRQEGFYPPVDPPLFNQHGGLVTPGFHLSMTPVKDKAGDIYYTTDGIDPRLPGNGGVSPRAMIYGSPIIITATTQIKARTLRDNTWSALNEATFRVVARDPKLRITEIMYNPLGGNDYEYLELTNLGNADLELSNATFEGIEFTFPVNATLAPGESIVLVADSAAFQKRYPEVAIGGEYRGKLSNAGETIILWSATGEEITAVQYADEGGWPLSADGRGDSLVLRDANKDPNAPKNWRASHKLYGSPGRWLQ